MSSSSMDKHVVGRLSRRAALAGGVSGLGALALAAAPSVFAADATPEADQGMEGLYVVTRTRVVVAGMSVDELTARVREGLVPIIEAIPGFVEYFIVQNPDTRQRTAVSIFEDKAGADISTTKATEFLKANDLAKFYENVEPVVTAGELILFAGDES
jgi:hypothetical protein